MKGIVESLEIKPNLIIKKGSKVKIKLGNSICSRTVTNIIFNDNIKSSFFEESSPYTVEIVSDNGCCFDKYDAKQLSKMIVEG